jgi:hypothetical protein
MTKTQIITELKAEYPTLTKHVDGEDIELSKVEYDATMSLWADIRIQKEIEAVADAEKQEAKTALLERLGITADEAALLLG